MRKISVVLSASAALLSSTVALASYFEPVALPVSQQTLYAELQLGYTQSSWNNNYTNGLIGPSSFAYFSPTSGGYGGVNAGFDLGYGMTRYLAIEAGWLHLPSVDASITTSGINVPVNGTLPAGLTASVDSWLAYSAMRFTLPVCDQISVFGKVGVGFRQLAYTVPSSFISEGQVTTGIGLGQYWAPIFATGVEYNDRRWILGAQYLYFPGNDKQNYGAEFNGGVIQGYGVPNAAPEVSMYSLFGGYELTI